MIIKENKTKLVRKRLMALILISGLVWGGFGGFTMLTENNNVRAGPDPPVIDGGTTEFNGNWYVDAGDNLIYMNQTIILNGNLQINDTGSLIFYNITLKMNCTGNGQYHIEVKNGGTFYIYDYDNINSTTEDASVIRNGTTHNHFMIWIRAGATFEMKNSELHECGWDVMNEGLIIETNGVLTDNCTISNNYFGITISSSFNTINNCNISSNDDTGIYLDGPYNNINNCRFMSNPKCGIFLSSYNRIVNCNISENGGAAGIYSHSSSNNDIIDCTIINNQIGIILWWYSNNNTITNCTVFSNTQKGIENIDFSNYTTIVNCRLENNGVGIDFDYSSNCRITTNNISNNNNGINLVLSSNNTIKGNDIFSNVNYGIRLSSSSSNNIGRNNVSMNDVEGIILSSSSHNVITNNNLYSNIENCTAIKSNSNDNTISNNNLSNSSKGIYIDNSFNNNITRNNIFGNDNGIEIGSSLNNIISNNSIYLNNNNGINVGGSYVYVLNNNVSNNLNDGIDILSSDWNFIIGNTISLNNRYGIYLENSPDTTIYHNNLIDNVNQAYDDLDYVNQWDNGYPSGGNYWSDFDEPSEGAYDDYQGPNQNILGRDGIVDNGSTQGGGRNPYIIDSGSQDNYPLMNPYPYSLFLHEGWNLISLPLIQPDTNLGTVLSTITGSYEAVQWYNVSDSSDPWKHNSTSKPSNLNDLENIDHSMGFWIHITEPGGVLFEYSGTLPTKNQTITLHPGWNLVGYPSFTSYNRTEGLNNLTFGTHVDSIWTYDAATQKWKELGPSDYFAPGKGYWVHAKVKSEWEVPL